MFKPNSYVTNYTPKHIRSTLVKIRHGILFLIIKTGRFVNCKDEDIICEVCNIEIEIEQHFICTCLVYNKKRNNMFKNVYSPKFNACSDKFISLMKSEQNNVGKFSKNCNQIIKSMLHIASQLVYC